MKDVSPYRFEQAMSALLGARARLLAEDPTIAEDDRLLHDMLEGDLADGDAMETIHRVIRQSIEQDRLAKDAEDYAKQVRERADRFKRRRDGLRGMVFAALDALGLARIQAGDFTASIVAGRPSVLITDEAALPDTYVRTKCEPNKSALLDALKRGEAVPGAELSTSLPALKVRTS